MGRITFELGDHDRAADELIKAYMGGGPETLEEEDPEYLVFLGTRADLNRRSNSAF
ncbi:hypothetical protein [Kitasatospora sp. NPDC005856]|uniref:hypothetical protein n=1 Tax=Kitasatospora sp. NPDC005856 TaxID=3154566 RepID=UPI0033FBE37D